MSDRYSIRETGRIITPALVVFREIVEANIERMLAIAGEAEKLRPHCKTHKTREVVALLQRRGIAKHKCATFAEAEMLAGAGVQDVLLAYNVVGPNIGRAVEFVERYTDVAFSVTADHPRPIAHLGEAMAAAGCSVDVLLDLDVGQHRTGVPVGEEALALYRQIAETPGLRPGGLHVYDGHQHQRSRDERAEAVLAVWEKVAAFRRDLKGTGLPVPRVVAGGTASFPIYAALDDASVECSPGTCVFHDAGYAEMFPDLDFTPAAVLLTRVISRPAADLVTLDLGYKAVASDPPADRRVVFPDLPGAEIVLHNEEHLVVRTRRAGDFQPGDELLAIPRHICPTTALHKQVFVVAGGRLAERWDVAARDRRLTL